MLWVTSDSAGIFGKVGEVTEAWEMRCCYCGYYAEGEVAEVAEAWERRDSGGKRLLTQADRGKAVVKHQCENLAGGSEVLAKGILGQGDPVRVPSKPMPAVLSKKAKV
ncbi:hypothetical protein BDR04DRAFT_1112445 [Suillus decipiens]|nr:hypothetical protein BDR04DRAFT_1112445 [Suillus decipiens]